MKFRISDIPDAKSTRELTISPGEFSLGDVEHDGLHLKVHFTKIVNTLQLRFEASTNLTLICDRSLETFSQPVSTTYNILYKPDIEEDDDEKQAIRPLNTSSNIIDIEQEVRESILLSIPIKKLHPRFLNEDGSETEYSATFGNQDSESETQETDPRWEALKQLKNNS